MTPRESDAPARLDAALAFGHDGVVQKPLDVIGWIGPAAGVQSDGRERLWRRLFLEAPLPYWQIVRWARRLTPDRLAADLRSTQSPGWRCVAVGAGSLDVNAVLAEVGERFNEFNADLFPWDYGDNDRDPPQRLKYVLGRELARSYVISAAQPRAGEDRSTLLHDHQLAWREWIALNEALGSTPEDVCEATALAMDHVVSRDITPGIRGVGRAHILLEQLNVNNSPAAGVVTASLLPLDSRRAFLDGMVVPDLRENGLLVISDEFLAGVAAAWRYSRSTLSVGGPTMLCFSVRPSVATVVQQLSGRSAEVAVLAAIESAIRRRALRPDAAASATLTLEGADRALSDPVMGPASFEDKKYVAAVSNHLTTVVVHAEIAQQWKQQNQAHRTQTIAKGPDVVASEFYRRDALRFLETRSLWKLSLKVPAMVTLAFAVLACFWQLYKWGASPPETPTVELVARLPLVLPALVAAEMTCLFLCLFVLLYSGRSIRVSLDSGRSSLLAFGVCLCMVAAAQFLPIGVRGEGLLDNPLYSVLFGEPQLTSQSVIEGGGAGLLVLHTLSQTTGFVTILFGVSAFVIRLIQTRAHTEPIYDDRCELIHKDWAFSLAMMGAFMVVVFTFGFARNTLWYYYLTTLPGVRLIDREGSFVEVIAPLVGICLVLMLSVGVVWLATLHAYLNRVVATAQGRSGYTSDDVVARLPRLARLLYLVRATE
ncbi:hypothetical protein Pla108_14320 [Botrimarina colliarenosi]|uniref:Uncharacterized protein n=1 Tax=Botrimarina colliarenosi TaxID=2528001 RepID=A0A5C6AM38_9BACT|nr:hypothetical protein [Botrimarina colliarenosi]TWU00481.1 hypothetical protein Pla108_14320 [Botrimarina colliarenosi]